jgi:outer membrane protein insertion porin family
MQVSENLETPMHLNSIRIIGASHTRAGFLGRVAAPYLVPASQSTNGTSPYSITSTLLSYIYPTSTSTTDESEYRPATETLRQVLAKTRNLSDDLSKFGIFDSVEAGLDKSRDVLADPYDVDLVLKVKESSRYFLRTATDVGDGEGNAVCRRIHYILHHGKLAKQVYPSRPPQLDCAMPSVVLKPWKETCPLVRGQNRISQ